ncbi:MAG: hypothetical protein WAL41_22535, partial [Mycobacterium sp.]
QPEAKTESSTALQAAKIAAPAAPVKGLGIAAGAKRPGAKKAAAPAADAAPAAPAPEAEAKPESKPADSNGDDGSQDSPAAPVKGLGIARGARPPGKR